ncbi:MAG: type II toxin-antitoxin system HicB family antitoxin [Asgard group archaeon]|nr:type II toxin-antitoxin system HicB family antitoxin [Asgard group archaeon]
MTIEKKKITILIEKDQDGILIASAPELPGCYTQAKSLNELMKRIEEAVDLYLKSVDKEFSENLLKDFVGIQFLEVPIG